MGNMVIEAVKGFGASARVTENPEEMCDWISPLLSKEVTVLVKGSRFMRMERIVEGLAA
jgi:UDP-N-acetylmuramoyl-tripeptide--D-alanyl-D-alanine ligase